MPDPATSAQIALPARALQDLLSTTGVREFIICAGARNSALLVILAAVPGLRLWHHFEERAAAFFALGRILDHGEPVAVVTTSGTAVAELLPAMIEAHYQGLPLIALTADRPASYRGTGAPQAIEQAGIFGPYPSFSWDITGMEASSNLLQAGLAWDRQSPLHLNLCLEEPKATDLPLLRKAGAALSTSRSPLTSAAPPSQPSFPDLSDFPEPILLIGDLLPREQASVRQVLLSLQRPIYAEAASGLRECPALRPWLIAGGDNALKTIPHRSVIRLGGVPACRFWRDLEHRPDIPVLSLTRSGHPGLSRHSKTAPLHGIAGWKVLPEVPAAPAAFPHPLLPPSLLQHLAVHPTSEPALIHALSRHIPDNAIVFTGNSLAIRQWNLCAEPAHPIHARALRGANGIDGNLSAFLGLAADAPEAWCLVGDLTALYDASAPWILPQMNASRLRIVVIQNAGGKIFSRLPALTGLTSFERQIMENPHQISLAGWARQWGLAHLSIQQIPRQPTQLPDRVVIELHPNPTATEAFWKARNQ